MERCNSIYCVQTRPVSSRRTLLISGYTSATHVSFRSDSFGACQSEGRLPPLPLVSLVVIGGAANLGPHLSDKTYCWVPQPGTSNWEQHHLTSGYRCTLNLLPRLIIQPSNTCTHSFLVALLQWQMDHLGRHWVELSLDLRPKHLARSECCFI